jgi:hypothetical protein
VQRDADMSTHPCPRATSRAPCCGGRRSRSPGPSMPCSRASNSHRPDLVVSFDCLMARLLWPRTACAVARAMRNRTERRHLPGDSVRARPIRTETK